jgi:hypothetical protein
MKKVKLEEIKQTERERDRKEVRKVRYRGERHTKT